MTEGIFSHLDGETQIVVIGAGIAGCILTRRLNRVGNLSVTCLERVLQHDHSEAGTGLNIGPNAVKALRESDPELAHLIAQASLPWRSLRKWTTGGLKLVDLELSDVADCEGWRIRWSDLYSVLRAASGGEVRFGSEIQNIGADPDDPARSIVCWTDARGQHEARNIHLLVGADGRYSQTRLHFSGAPTVNQLGVAVFRLLVEDTSDGMFDDHEQWFNGPNRLLAFKVKPNYIYIAGSLPLGPDAEISKQIREEKALRAAFTPTNGKTCHRAIWLINQICVNARLAHWARMQEHDIRFSETAPSVLYLGDAAHGMIPTLGQGATQAIEDACFAGELIAREAGLGRLDPMEWLWGISAGRRERVQFAMDFSRSASQSLLSFSNSVDDIVAESQPSFLAKLRRLYRELPAVDQIQPQTCSASTLEVTS